MGKGGGGGGRGGGGGGGSTASAIVSLATSRAKERAPDYRRSYPTGAAQQTILDALGASGITNSAQANAFFDELGFTVTAQRVGRRSVPVVKPINTSGGGINIFGEGESWANTRSIPPSIARFSMTRY